jgi:hypothetical protein
MFRRYLLSGAIAVLCSTAAMSSAQTPTTGSSPQIPSGASAAPAQPRTPTPQASTTDRKGSTTIIGCLVRDQDVPGHTPNVAGRADAAADYILVYTNRPEAVGTSGSAAPGAIGSGGSSATRTADLGPLYKIEGLGDDRLKTLIGKRVEVIGAYDERADRNDVKEDAARQSSTGSGSNAQTGTDANAGRGDEKMDWREFQATSIREVSGSCPSPASSFSR